MTGVSGAMPYYRLYFIDGSGHIRHAVELECADDDAARAQAMKHADGRVLELWNRDRLVWRQDPADAATGPGPAGGAA